MCHFEILPLFLQSVVKVLLDPSRFYSWCQKQRKTALLTDASADLGPGDLLRRSQANVTRVRIQIAGTSLAVQWLPVSATPASAVVSSPGQGKKKFLN